MKQLLIQQLAKAAFGEVCTVYSNIRQSMSDAGIKERAVMSAALFGAMRGVADVFYDSCIAEEPELVAIYETSRTHATDAWNKHKAEYGAIND